MKSQVISEFRNNSSFRSDNEVSLFRKFAHAIVNNSNSVFIDETHGGNVCNVSFTSPTNKQETCEISDLLIVCMCPQTQRFRATFWQAKKQGVSKWVNVTQNGEQLDFKGQFNQWDLLSRRPELAGVKGFNPPKDILASFSSPSIGTFGVFYEKSAAIELAHSTAEFISCPSPATKSPTMAINGYLSKYSLNEMEMISTLSLDGFLDALFEFRVGALLDNTNSTHSWLVSRVRAKLKEQVDSSSLEYIDRFLNNDVSDISEYEDFFGGLSILFVNIGERSAIQYAEA